MSAAAPWPGALVIAGGARGADTLAEEWAKASGVEWIVYHADWATLGRNAGPIRNKRMLDEGRPDLVVAVNAAGLAVHAPRAALIPPECSVTVQAR